MSRLTSVGVTIGGPTVQQGPRIWAMAATGHSYMSLPTTNALCEHPNMLNSLSMLFSFGAERVLFGFESLLVCWVLKCLDCLLHVTACYYGPSVSISTTVYYSIATVPLYPPPK